MVQFSYHLSDWEENNLVAASPDLLQQFQFCTGPLDGPLNWTNTSMDLSAWDDLVNNSETFARAYDEYKRLLIITVYDLLRDIALEVTQEARPQVAPPGATAKKAKTSKLEKKKSKKKR